MIAKRLYGDELKKRNIKIINDFSRLRKRFCVADCYDLLSRQYNMEYISIQTIIQRKNKYL